ncbi:MAG TPA: SAM-dependent methyltransferase [Streptosporangiaceae bacterium]|nr:SAM-dependent methyltransferase [Streptosporangiaceae bacterium]
MADQQISPESVPKPNQARIYDYLLGGHNSLPVDREVADALLALTPIARATAVENRRFLGRAVRLLAARGIRQFLDVGAGLPTQENVHQIAQQAAPDARVLYVDNDPTVIAEGQALLTNEDQVAMAEADLRQPASIFALPEVHRLLDFRQPIALLLIGVLYFISEDEDPYSMVTQLRDALAPGSYLAISHATRDTLTPEQLAEGTRIYSRGPGATLRTRVQIERFLDGFDLVDPGLVLVSDWRPDGRLPSSADTPAMFGAVGQVRYGGKVSAASDG